MTVETNYEIIRERLVKQAGELRKRAESLNHRRQELFGATEMAVVGQDRIRTHNSCIPRDIVPIGDRLLFGYNVRFGLKRTTSVDEVFSLHRFERTDDGFQIASLAEDGEDYFLGQPEFVAHFDEIFTYYSGVQLLQLHRTENRLFAVLGLGKTNDVRVLRWGIEGDRVQYIDHAGHLESRLPDQHDFEWIATTRKDQVRGKHPHVSILDEVFVETIEGDLTIKIENNTETGQGIYAEPVEDPRQSLNDASFEYVRIGNLILIRILPYREKDWRYFAYNALQRSVMRLDAIDQSCIRLPEQQGIVVPGGYVLVDGTAKRFDADVAGMHLQDVVRAPNREDVMYVYHRPSDGLYLLQAYNLIRKEVATPIPCHGYSLFDDGTMVVFRFAVDEPTRVHPMQIWQTSFCSDEHLAARPTNGSELANLGNAELVKGISDAFGLCRMVAEQKPSVTTYEALIATAQRAIDNYFWLGNASVGDLRTVIEEIIATAELVIDEFRKVQTLMTQSREELDRTERAHRELMRQVEHADWHEIQRYVDGLDALRTHRGHLITLKETRYIDVERLDALEAESVERFDELSKRTVDFLVDGDSLAHYGDELEAILNEAERVDDTPAATALTERLDGVSTALQLLTEVVSGLQVDDPNKRTQMLEIIGEILGQQNRARAVVKTKTQTLFEREGKAEFAVQFQLLSQTVTSALAMCNSPEACDAQLTKMMVQLEELESRFSVFDGFLADLVEKRDEIYEAFEGKKQTLLEERQRKIHTLAQAAGRVIAGIERRAAGLKSVDDANAYFAADAMVIKVRDMASKLREHGDDVKADDVETRLKSAKDQAIRQLRDKLDLFDGGTNLIKLGRHRFSVGTAEPELTVVAHGDGMALHVTGTEFFEPVDDARFAETRDFWSQHLPSETHDVYRAEYLAACVLFDAAPTYFEEESLLKLVRRAVEERYDEGYERGVHDVDAARILAAVGQLHREAGLLRYSGDARALALSSWTGARTARPRQAKITKRAQSAGRLRAAFGDEAPLRAIGRELADLIRESATFAPHLADEAGQYLAEELAVPSPRFVASSEAPALLDSFIAHLEATDTLEVFEAELADLDQPSAVELLADWLRGFAAHHAAGEWQHLVYEAALLHLSAEGVEREVSSAITTTKVEGLLGQHPSIVDGSLSIRLDEFMSRLTRFREEHVPAYRAYRHEMHELLERQRDRLRLGELRPKVLSTFVRNRLIDDVYLPIIGDNLAKQVGAAGQEGRSDRSGLLLLISPPGYGKTTLMEYVAARLGLMFVKVNGPSLGHDVVSLDPAQAPNATARQEVEKINFALEMGNNVMLYVDDIQHTNPELLQKFISLCDATRRIEGVWKGRTKTYDLRGKRFAVVMAGNPYTESGARFQIPDMLANRADTYNLGDILAGHESAFEMSYIENALTSNPVTAPLGTRHRDDIERFSRLAAGEQVPLSEFDHAYSPVEAQEITNLFAKLGRVRDVVLEVNRHYIKSAAMQDDFRKEPPFQLQGSYRNMNKMAEKLAAVMNDEEVDRVIVNHYQQEAQTLTSGSEHNLLKLGELRGTLTPTEAERWAEIRREFARRKMFGSDEDPIARIASPLATLVERLGDLQSTLSSSPLSTDMRAIRTALEKNGIKEPNGSSNAAELMALREALTALKEARLEVQVVGDLPTKFSETLEHQLAIIESALVPLSKAVHAQLGERDATERSLRDIMARLDRIGAAE